MRFHEFDLICVEFFWFCVAPPTDVLFLRGHWVSRQFLKPTSLSRLLKELVCMFDSRKFGDALVVSKTVDSGCARLHSRGQLDHFYRWRYNRAVRSSDSLSVSRLHMWVFSVFSGTRRHFELSYGRVWEEADWERRACRGPFMICMT